jgi:tetratricopeptide (TPR) repeat protein
MEMFVDRRVPAHDLRLDVVRKRLRSNLLRIRRLAEDSGAQVVFSTVAVNLRQSPPFLSVHDERLDAGMLATWKEAFQRGRDKLSSSDLSGARKAFQQALDLDDGVAEAHYLLGQAFLASQRLKEAQNHFRKARDLDALRFRADSSINEIIRQVAGPDLVDAEAILGAASSVPGLPGRELFFEHVHLRFQGTYLLAQALAEAIGTRLPLPPATSPRLSSRECAQRLALTSWDQARSLQSILNMVRRPPFTHQSGHEETVLGLHQELLSSRGRARTRGDETLKAFRLALQNRAHDVYLRDRYTELLQEEGLFHEAIEQLEALLELDPQSPRWRTRLGFVLADQGHTEEARKLLSGLLADFPDMEGPYLNLGTLLLQSDDLVGAESVHRKGLARLPLSVTLRLGLGHVLEKAHRPREARDLYLEILDLDPGSAQAHLRLAELHDKAGAWKDAQREYRAALALDPLLVTAHNNLGLILEKQGFLDQAIVAYDQAIEVDPYYALAHFNLADALFLAGETSEAISSYRAALELDPENSQGRHNLALALAQERQQKTLSQGTAPTP